MCVHFQIAPLPRTSFFLVISKMKKRKRAESDDDAGDPVLFTELREDRLAGTIEVENGPQQRRNYTKFTTDSNGLPLTNPLTHLSVTCSCTCTYTRTRVYVTQIVRVSKLNTVVCGVLAFWLYLSSIPGRSKASRRQSAPLPPPPGAWRAGLLHPHCDRDSGSSLIPVLSPDSKDEFVFKGRPIAFFLCLIYIYTAVYIYH